MTGFAQIVEMDGAYLRPIQKRDSVLIADQLKYGFGLKDVEEGTGFGLPDWTSEFMDSVEVVRSWQIDTLSARKMKGSDRKAYDIECNVIVTSFDEGVYGLPRIAVRRVLPDGQVDTLLFGAMEMDVRTMPVDTATFEVHDIKGQARYPVTFKELVPYMGGVMLTAALIAFIVWMIRRYRKNKGLDGVAGEPAHIVALRKLDRLRGNKYWAPEKQKFFYTGVTDALREYLVARYDVYAMEMTTAEIFDALKDKEMSQELRDGLKSLFEQSDFVKFAKLTLPDEENVKVVPFAVRFVSETYQEILEEEERKDVL